MEAAAPSPFISFPSGLGLVGSVFTEAAGREGQAGALDKEAAWLAPATVIAHAAPLPAPPTPTSPAQAPPLPASVAQRPSPLSRPQFPSLNSGGHDNPAGGGVRGGGIKEMSPTHSGCSWDPWLAGSSELREGPGDPLGALLPHPPWAWLTLNAPDVPQRLGRPFPHLDTHPDQSLLPRPGLRPWSSRCSQGRFWHPPHPRPQGVGEYRWLGPGTLLAHNNCGPGTQCIWGTATWGGMLVAHLTDGGTEAPGGSREGPGPKPPKSGSRKARL